MTNFNIQYASLVLPKIGKNSGGSVNGSKVGVPFNSWEYADLASATAGPDDEQRSGSWRYVSRRVSYLARAEYDYNEKYLASFTIRRDGSTNFGQNNKFGFFPSASLGWVATSEDLLLKSMINFLKLEQVMVQLVMIMRVHNLEQ